jgi:hypothetical protein
VRAPPAHRSAYADVAWSCVGATEGGGGTHVRACASLVCQFVRSKDVGADSSYPRLWDAHRSNVGDYMVISVATVAQCILLCTTSSTWRAPLPGLRQTMRTPTQHFQS